ncbi:Response regulator [Sulfidibacter corallicola]|uniref:Response regulator n=1 Tax=Sulfidibacter corallicola TaxID=2818388 RepID=A0A8A4TEF5_SULCO|nr:response regulator [Sulfidibacter corallicola]QTD47604.1 response regulator [Sulfidibacter corallicola]
MHRDMFQERIEEILKTGNEKLLHSFLMRGLKTDRQQTIGLLNEVLPLIGGRNRLKVMEILIDDGEKDLIPLFVRAIVHEKNMLFAKSLLFIYRNFSHYEAVFPLESIEDRLVPELGDAFKRVIGTLRAKHHHRFNMQAFRDRDDQPDLLRETLDMMLKEPDPAYAGFLIDRLNDGTDLQVREALRGLDALGDADSVPTLLEFLAARIEQKKLVDRLGRFLVRPESHEERGPADYAQPLADLVGWDDTDRETFHACIQQGKGEAVLSMVRGGFGLNGDLWMEVSVFLTNTLSGEKPQESALASLNTAFAAWQGEQDRVLTKVCEVLGRIRFRCDGEDATERIEAAIPESESARPVMLIAYLEGCRSANALKRLLAYVSFPPDEVVLRRALEALTAFSFETLPLPLLDVVRTGPDAGIREMAMDILARAGYGSVLVEDVLVGAPAERLPEIAQAVARHRVQGGGARLADLLEDAESESLALVLIESLRAFPGSRTGPAVKPFFQPGNPKAIRDAALETLLVAGGPERLQYLLDGLNLFPTIKKDQLVRQVCERLATFNREQFPPGLLEAMDFWLSLLQDARDEQLRYLVLQVLQSADWGQARNKRMWVESLRSLSEDDEPQRSSEERRLLRVLIIKAEGDSRTATAAPAEPPPVAEPAVEEAARPEGPASRRRLDYMLDQLETSCHHQRAGALRRLNLMYKPHLLKNQPHEEKRLVDNVLRLFEQNQGVTELTRVCISLAVKVGHPRLLERVDTCLYDTDLGVVQFADRALAMVRKAEMAQSIQTIHLLDDTRLVTRTLSSLLTRSGFQVEIDNCPEDALVRLERGRFDLGIVDLIMPKLDGVSFIREIRRRQLAPRRLVVITSSRDENLHRVVRGLDVDALLLKPFPMARLVDCIRGLEAS